jgi:glucose-6-phosphate 1-epimerase
MSSTDAITTAEPFDFRGMPAIRWRSRDGASAVATLQGGQIVSWVPAGGEERLYLSERSAFEAGRPIRGGVPICFPQFADHGSLPEHGFARTQAWSFVGASETQAGSCATFSLQSSPRTLALWPAAFRIELIATLAGAHLDMQVHVANAGQPDFAFTAALHTYLRVSEAATARLEGLRGARYANRGSSAVEVETREAITAADPIDRVYFATPAATRLDDAGRILRIEQRGFTDTVVWNPGRERTARMADMPPEGFRRMLCVEAAAIEPPVLLASGAVWTGGQAISILQQHAAIK